MSGPWTMWSGCHSGWRLNSPIACLTSVKIWSRMPASSSGSTGILAFVAGPAAALNGSPPAEPPVDVSADVCVSVDLHQSH